MVSWTYDSWIIYESYNYVYVILILSHQILPGQSPISQAGWRATRAYLYRWYWSICPPVLGECRLRDIPINYVLLIKAFLLPKSYLFLTLKNSKNVDFPVPTIPSMLTVNGLLRWRKSRIEGKSKSAHWSVMFFICSATDLNRRSVGRLTKIPFHHKVWICI